MAPARPQRMIVRDASESSALTSMNLPMVFATAVPPRTGPMKWKAPTRITACIGVMAREATTVAIMFEASWKPFV